jgi:hypothetical protein
MRQQAMRLRRFVTFWIMLFVAAGLVVGPLAAPVFATKMLAATSDEMQAMSDDMPCCPDQPNSKDWASCPLVALCMLAVSLPAPSGAGSLIERYPLRSIFATTDDLLIDGLGAKPPDHPPRTLV